MNENIKTFSLAVITVCVFIITVIQILNMMAEQKERAESHALLHAQQDNGIGAMPQLSLPAAHDSTLNMPLTSIQFEEMKYDFGDMKKGDVVSHSFKFKNTGNNPLLITNAHGTCGCTIPSYPKEPIAPGKEAILEVQFNSTGKEGLQNKSISVTANTDPQYTVLSIVANVKPVE